MATAAISTAVVTSFSTSTIVTTSAAASHHPASSVATHSATASPATSTGVGVVYERRGDGHGKGKCHCCYTQHLTHTHFSSFSVSSRPIPRGLLLSAFDPLQTSSPIDHYQSALRYWHEADIQADRPAVSL
jgi:hypothetical protein